MGGSKFVKDEVENETDLHQIIMEDIETLEEGITILKNEFQCGDQGIADFLYVDSGNRLGVIEAKIDTDENIIFQGLRHYDWITKNRTAIVKMFPNIKINPNEEPRLTLIAKYFSNDIRSLTTHLKPDVELFEYTLLRFNDNERGLCFHPVSSPKIEEISSKPMTEQYLIEYITDEKLRNLFIKKIKQINRINPIFKKRVTQDYIGFLYNGRFVACLNPLRKAFIIQVAKLDNNAHVIEYPWVRIENGNEDYSSQIKHIKDAIKKLDRKNKRKIYGLDGIEFK